MIYFLEKMDDQAAPIKIGCTRNLVLRLKDLETQYGCRLWPLGVMPGSYETEVRLNDRFWHLHAYYEWFHRGPDLLDYIALNARQWTGFPDFAPPRDESIEARRRRESRDRQFEVIQKRRIYLLSRGFKDDDEEVRSTFGGRGLGEAASYADEFLRR